MKKFFLMILFVVTACDNNTHVLDNKREFAMDRLSELKINLAFTCAHENIPEPDPEADVLFKYARWLQKNNVLKQDKLMDAEIERLYRIAAEHDHYKANMNLQSGAMRGFFKLDGREYLRLSQKLISAGVATGYFFIGKFLQQGSAGLARDPEMALRYLRKSADEGSAAGQAYIAEKLAPINIAPLVANTMYRCAAEQGHGDAATSLGVKLSIHKQYAEAVKAFQMGVAAGDETSAGFLESGFAGPLETDELNYLGQEEDQERVRRYKTIGRILARYSYAHPKVPEINEIVPLPPAPLPEWDGKLQWLEARLANIPPEKPSEELIKRLADEKMLEPATGRPMPGAAGFDQSKFPVKGCFSGQVCPQTGYWKAMWLPHEARGMLHSEVIRHVKEGEIMPTHFAERYFVRSWPFSDKHTVTEERVHWGLLG
ncbi:DUF6396 domain-containing protein [Pseudomonas sp. HR96]|uniref:SEL1-like repeat protein n=1 Tax=Pseudomonas sp. HR96 TaxID=1027966 RepID=UPI002A74CF6A|nr:DUF6396 domain-containing protein [Pseudomonas sp. HR96]WPO98709.1 DUF6396 domain-containing protein [Pseudomonas sp. HR96]